MSGRNGKRRSRFKINQEPAVTYAIGDVHGHVDKLKELEALIVSDSRAVHGVKLIVMLGDYIDRGPNSRGVLQHLLDPPPAGFYRIPLVGNHDIAFHAVLSGQSQPSSMIAFGGLPTFASYGCDLEEYSNGLRLNNRRIHAELAHHVPAEHVAFLRGLPILFETPRFVFAHAGLRPGVSIAQQADRDLVLIREPFLSGPPANEKTVIHGHTPSGRPRLRSGSIGIDTGAGFGGALTAVRLDDANPVFLTSGA